MAAFSGELPAYQESAYTDLCDLWEPSASLNAGADPSDLSYTLHTTGVPCRFVTKSAVDSPAGIALLDGDDLLTVDTVRLPYGSPVATNWLIVNKSIDANGNPGPLYGQAYKLRGDPKKRMHTEQRPAGRVVAYVTKVRNLPAGVS